MKIPATIATLVFGAFASAAATGGQSTAPHQHTPGMTHETAPAQAGQSAFAAITEIVAILEADPSTDWSRVDLDALRAHLADMDAVMLRSRVTKRPVDGGLSLDITGDATVAPAITRMLVPHAGELDTMPEWRATAAPIDGGVRLTVTARTDGDRATEARIRGLGFGGLLVQGDHHPRHHLLIARGQAPHTHR